MTFNVTGADDSPTITGGVVSGSLTEDAGPSTIVNGGFETGDLTGWTASSGSITAQFVGFGADFGNYAANLGATASPQSLSQDVATTPGQHYTLTFFVLGDPEASSNALNVTWDGTTILSLSDDFSGLTGYTFDVVGDPSNPTTHLQFNYADDGVGMYVDQVALGATPGPATEHADGNVTFADIETADTHTASFTPEGTGYVGTFSIDPVTETGGSGSVDWHFAANNSDLQFLAQGQALTQSYAVSVTDDHGASVLQTVSVTLIGTNDAPTAVSENVITDVGPNGTVDIPAWSLAANDTDPDTIDHLFVNNIVSSSGGTAVPFIDAFFVDDATPGGSFTYTTSDGIATSSNAATATVVNNPTGSTTLTGTSGDDVIIATNGTETLSGGGGNDVLIGNSGAHTMTGGTGNDTFAFIQTTDGPATITDFNNTTQQDHIAVSASGFGAGLSAHMDVTPLFETSNDNQFSGNGQVFHFDTANQTLYFSGDGTTGSEMTLAVVQPGVTINPHDILIV